MSGKFFKIKCTKCKNEQIIFDRAATTIKCLVCGAVMAEPTGGRIKINTDATQILE